MSRNNYNDTYISVNRNSYLKLYKGAYSVDGVEELKDRLRSARKEAGLTQAQLSRAAGVKQPVISDLEQGKQQSTAALVKIAEALGITPKWLDSGKGPKLAPAQKQPDPSTVAVLTGLEDLTGAQIATVQSVVDGLRDANRARDE